MSKKSNVWQFFYKANDTVATCCLCNRNYSRKGRGTTCLRNHLKSKHPVEFQTLAEDIRCLVKREVTYRLPQHPTSQLELKLHKIAPDPLEMDNEDQLFARCDEHLAQMFLNHSFDLIEGPGFINFVKVLHSGYVIKARGYYENILCRDIHNRLHVQVKQQVDLLGAISLSTSLWWANNDGLLSLSCFGVTSDFKAQRLTLKCEALSYEDTDRVAYCIQGLISGLDMGLSREKVHCIIRDEATALAGALPDCSVSRLQMCVRFALQENQQLQNLYSKCKQIVEHFASSTMAQEQLKFIQEIRLKQEPCSIIAESPLRWNSIFDIMGRVLKMKDALSLYAEENSLVQIYPDEWLDIDLCKKVMQPCEEIIKMWSDPSTTASSVIPLVAALRDSLRTDVHNFVSSVTICSFARKLLEELEMKFSHITTDIKYLVATYLDPRYKQAFFNDREEQLVTNEVLQQLTSIQGNDEGQPSLQKVKISSSQIKNESKIDTILDNILASGSAHNQTATTSFSSQSQFKNLLYLYNSEPRIERSMDPLIWWKTNIKYSPLYRIVRQFLSAPAASASNEALFGESAHLYSDMQGHLSPESVSKILFIKSNSKVSDNRV
ncbi:zinc finger BED domain-containing protein 1 isoform X1 [Drosophila pseudoobscura]|uniref:Zinc finger BED domain-containing protein 1 isoform X1 n=1 Tax=Drosophila pseudoobscura pseudoobscura TaxID=46245 RepID=A0A6I8UHX9_DROPS|nr:zinc finger BED domain-containing protein 1 isoform X1 [Drosophila pseudoobscura]